MVVAILEVSAALLVELGVYRVLAALEHQIVVVGIDRRAHKGSADSAEEHLEARAVKQRMVNVEECVDRLLGFKDAAAIQLSADDLERIDESILDELKLKFAQLLNVNGLEYLRRVALNKLSVIIVGEGR